MKELLDLCLLRKRGCLSSKITNGLENFDCLVTVNLIFLQQLSAIGKPLRGCWCRNSRLSCKQTCSQPRLPAPSAERLHGIIRQFETISLAEPTKSWNNGGKGTVQCGGSSGVGAACRYEGRTNRTMKTMNAARTIKDDINE